LVSAGHPKEDDERRKKRLHDLAPLKSAYGDALFGQVRDLGYPFNEAVRIRMEQSVGHWWCVFDLHTNVDLPKQDRELDQVEGSTEDAQRTFHWNPNPAADWLRERWAQRYNKRWTSIIDAWSAMLEGEVRAFGIDEENGIDAAFDIGAVTAWSRPSHDHPYFHGGRQ
jgi:hypothetical protein